MQTPAVAASPSPHAAAAPFAGEVPTPETLASFARALNAVKQRVKAQIGAADIRDMRRLRRIALAIEAAGRLMIHFCFEPILFTVGVLTLWIAKQISVMEVGHTVLHGTYDGMSEAPDLHSDRYWWPAPIHEASWKYAHNVRHHGATNIAGMDPDIHFGTVRLTAQTPYKKHHALQTPTTLLAIFPFFGFWMNAHVTGLLDLYLGNDRADGFDFIPDRSAKTRRMVWKKALSKYLPYYGKELVLFPLLAWTQWWKVLLANCIAETLTAIYSAATIYCGHTGEKVSSWPEGTRPQSRGQWYAMQIAASQNFAVPRPLSIMCGALDYQIEHHLFPTFPPKRLRQIAPEVRAICAAHGIQYKSDTWPRTLARVFQHLWQLSRKSAGQPTGAALGAP
jgi:fatty acid desaturase